MEPKKRVLVVSGHAADFIWRAGGTIANYTAAGCEVKVICMSFGQRGESESVWKANPGITEDEVAALRKPESEGAAKALGCQIQFYNLQDHLMVIEKDTIMQLAKDIREFNPDIVLTHSAYDPFNPDHDNVHKAVLAALRSANVTGTFPDIPKTKQVEIFCFEPDQPEASNYMPDVIIDITDSWETKRKAMEQIKSQAFMLDLYGDRTKFRGVNANRFRPGTKYAEVFKRITPYVDKFF